MKIGPNGEIAKYKAVLVAKGFLQKPGIDFNKVNTLFSILETIRVVVEIVSYKEWKMHQLEVKFVFLNGPPEEEVYVKQPSYFEIKGK